MGFFSFLSGIYQDYYCNLVNKQLKQIEKKEKRNNKQIQQGCRIQNELYFSTLAMDNTGNNLDAI